MVCIVTCNTQPNSNVFILYTYIDVCVCVCVCRTQCAYAVKRENSFLLPWQYCSRYDIIDFEDIIPYLMWGRLYCCRKTYIICIYIYIFDIYVWREQLLKHIILYVESLYRGRSHNNIVQYRSYIVIRRFRVVSLFNLT